MSALFGSATLLTPAGKTIAPASLDGRIVGIYFASKSCINCHEFTPELVRFYDDAVSKKKHFEVVFVSMDRDEACALACFTEMPWLMLAFLDHRVKEMLADRFEVQRDSTPVLVVLDEQGKLLTKGGKRLVSRNIPLAEWHKDAPGLEPEGRERELDKAALSSHMRSHGEGGRTNPPLHTRSGARDFGVGEHCDRDVQVGRGERRGVGASERGDTPGNLKVATGTQTESVGEKDTPTTVRHHAKGRDLRPKEEQAQHDPDASRRGSGSQTQAPVSASIGRGGLNCVTCGSLLEGPGEPGEESSEGLACASCGSVERFKQRHLGGGGMEVTGTQ